MEDINLRVSYNSFKEYQERINRVLDYIENNLGADLSLETLSKVACFSSFHFHRIFHSLIGETAGNYVKKRRLVAAANRIKHIPFIKISEVVYQFGFSGQSDFSRSFKSFFKTSPSKYSKQKRNISLNLNGEEDICWKEQALIVKEMKDSIEKNINIKRMEDFSVIYIRNIGLSKEHKSKAIEASFRKLYIWAKARGLLNQDTIVMGITLDNPEILPFNECRHDACITVTEKLEPDGCIGVRTVFSKGMYVTVKFDRDVMNFSKTFFEGIDYVYGYWMPQNGYAPDDKPCIEIYKPDLVTDGMHIELCIPIKPF